MKDQIVENCNQELQTIYLHLEQMFKEIASPGMDVGTFKSIKVVYYDILTPLQELGTIKLHDAQTITITPYDKDIVTSIIKAINKKYSHLNVTSNQNIIVINLPVMSEDLRKSSVKKLKALCDDHKVKVRTLRHTFVNKIKKELQISENEQEMLLDQLQIEVNAFNKKIDDFYKSKADSLMQI